jgi:hypothetical protein
MSNAPKGLGPAGRRLWRKVTADWELDAGDYELLIQACRTVSELDRLAAALSDVDPFVTGSTGQVKVHPAYAELRMHRATLAALLGKLGIEDDEDSSPEAAWRSQRAKDAANARWAYRRKDLAS